MSCSEIEMFVLAMDFCFVTPEKELALVSYASRSSADLLSIEVHGQKCKEKWVWRKETRNGTAFGSTKNNAYHYARS